MSLSDSDAGLLFKQLLTYHFNEEEIQGNAMSNFAFSFFKPLIDSNKEKYRAVCERNRKNGANGGRPPKTQDNPNNPVGSFGNPNNPKIEEDKIKEKKIKKERTKELFDSFYSQYPNKKSRKVAEDKFEKLLKESKEPEILFDEIMQGLNNFLGEIKLKGTEKQFIAHPSTWLNQNRWLDEYEKPVVKSKYSW